ncbi:MAG: hypothetical protein JO283_00555 [Bradyrhizobium sp.]|nr:hypothetical protein [Bradyrhizobium sp.]
MDKELLAGDLSCGFNLLYGPAAWRPNFSDGALFPGSGIGCSDGANHADVISRQRGWLHAGLELFFNRTFERRFARVSPGSSDKRPRLRFENPVYSK